MNDLPWGDSTENEVRGASTFRIDESCYNNNFMPSSLAYWFSGMTNLSTVDLLNLKTDSVNSMKQTFYQCSNLETIDITS